MSDEAGAAPFAHAARFVSVDPAEHRFRFYELRLQATLWGGVALVRAWGRLGTPGRWCASEYPDRAAAQAGRRAGGAPAPGAGLPPRGGALSAPRGLGPALGRRVGGARRGPAQSPQQLIAGARCGDG